MGFLLLLSEDSYKVPPVWILLFFHGCIPLLANLWWDMIIEFTDGDMAMLPKLVEFAEKTEGADDEWKEKIEVVNQFIGPALEAYFTKQGINPFEGAEQ